MDASAFACEPIGQQAGVVRPDRSPRPCGHCGLEFRPPPPGGKAYKAFKVGARWGIYCSTACHGAARTAASAERPSKPKLTCAICAMVFTSRQPHARFCSDDCRREAARLAARQAPKPMQCKECGARFVTQHGAQQFCSPSCGKRHAKRARRKLERARMRGAKVETVNPLAVFERDGWRCHLCRRLTRRDKRGTIHPFAPELDHIVPLAAGGEHSRVNTACARRACNGRKGARPFGQPSLLASVCL
jgi:5-methylcytosine-specific restriction endonuclease McrA